MVHKGITYLNRKETPLPKERALIRILHNDVIMGMLEHVCEWLPHHPESWPHDRPKPDNGYIGTAKVIMGRYKGIGLHAWEQNDSEFIYYELYHETKPNPEYGQNKKED